MIDSWDRKGSPTRINDEDWMNIDNISPSDITRTLLADRATTEEIVQYIEKEFIVYCLECDPYPKERMKKEKMGGVHVGNMIIETVTPDILDVGEGYIPDLWRQLVNYRRVFYIGYTSTVERLRKHAHMYLRATEPTTISEILNIGIVYGTDCREDAVENEVEYAQELNETSPDDVCICCNGDYSFNDSPTYEEF